MSILRKLLILIILIIFIYIMMNLLKKRGMLFHEIENQHKQAIEKHIKEGMSNKDPEYGVVTSDIAKVAINVSDYPSGLNSVLSNLQYLPIKQFCIKGSVNSAYSGKYISDEMVKYVLSRGCRFLDFELYYLPKNNSPSADYDVFVGYSSDPLAFNPNISNTKMVSFQTILTSTIGSAFSSQAGSSYITTNVHDPLFIQLRIKTDEKNKPNLYRMVKARLDAVKQQGYDKYFYNDKVSGDDAIRKYMNKMVLVFENDPDNNSILGGYVNMVANTSALLRKDYASVNLKQFPGRRPNAVSHTTTDVNTFTEVMPVNNKSGQSNPNIYSSIQNYGNQITMMQYYVDDMNLKNGENMFKQYNGGIVPMTNCLTYITNYADPNSLT